MLVVTPAHEGHHFLACRIGILEAASRNSGRYLVLLIDTTFVKSLFWVAMACEACGDRLKRGAGRAPVDALVLTIRTPIASCQRPPSLPPACARSKAFRPVT